MLLRIKNTVATEHLETTHSSLPSQWTKPLESSLQSSTGAESLSFFLTVIAVAGVTLLGLFFVGWILSLFRKEDGVSLSGHQPHFFWIKRK